VPFCQTVPLFLSGTMPRAPSPACYGSASPPVSLRHVAFFPHAAPFPKNKWFSRRIPPFFGFECFPPPAPTKRSRFVPSFSPKNPLSPLNAFVLAQVPIPEKRPPYSAPTKGWLANSYFIVPHSHWLDPHFLPLSEKLFFLSLWIPQPFFPFLTPPHGTFLSPPSVLWLSSFPSGFFFFFCPPFFFLPENAMRYDFIGGFLFFFRQVSFFSESFRNELRRLPKTFHFLI